MSEKSDRLVSIIFSFKQHNKNQSVSTKKLPKKLMMGFANDTQCMLQSLTRAH